MIRQAKKATMMPLHENRRESMKRALVICLLCPLAVAPAFVSLRRPVTGKGFDGKVQAARAPQTANPRIVDSYGKLPLSFEVNEGQTDSQVKFIARGTGYSLFLTSTEAVLSLKAPSISAVVLKMKLVGANPSPHLTGRDELPGKSNYFIGDDPAKWRTNVSNYAKVKYADVYPGVDLVYYGNQRQLEYDFLVAPGADPGAIRLAIDGCEKSRIDKQGDLVLEVDRSEIRLHQPVIYQEINRSRRSIGGKFVMRSGREVGFEIARYDASKPLIIDPVISYSTYLGGSGDESVGGIAVDSAGNAYITGTTDSSDFPTANPLQAVFHRGICETLPVGTTTFPCSVAFVTKLNAAGSGLIYSTYLGGGGRDAGRAIAVDFAGNAYVTGSTNSTNFPTANAFQPVTAGQRDAFVTKLNPTGSALLYSTYLGGSGADFGAGIAVDSSGNAYVTGLTGSSDFPTANAFQSMIGGSFNAFVTKLNAAGSALVYSTYLGGSGGNDGAAGIAVDSSGNAYVTGSTNSRNFPTANAFQAAYAGGLSDAFVTKVNAAGSALVYSTYLGGSGSGDYGDQGTGIAVDSAGNAYVTGYTDSNDFPTVNAFQPVYHCCNGYEYMGDAFVTKLNAAGSAVYSSHLGGSVYDIGSGIAVDSSGNAYVTGSTYSHDFPTASPFQAAYAGTFVTMINAAGSALVYSTYLGASFTDAGTGIAVDSAGNVYVIGTTSSTNFPTANPFQAAYGGDTCTGTSPFYGIPCNDAFVTKLPAVSAGLDPWQQAITALKTAAGSDSQNFWQWAWYWQYQPAFPGAPAGFGAVGSISPAVMEQIIVAGGGNGFQVVSAEQWMLYFRQVTQPPDPWNLAIATMKTAAGSDSQNFWQWAWYWQYLPAFQGGPSGFGVVGSISPGFMEQIITAGGGDGFMNVSAEQWLLYYRSFPTVVNGVLNAASHLAGAIAPGELVIVTGSGLGPTQVVTATPDSNGLYSAQLAGTTVLVNGTPVPLISTSATQVTAAVPGSINGIAQVTVIYQGQVSAAFPVPVAPAAPGIFTVDSTGQGHAATVNQDGLINTAAHWGDVMTLFVTGVGQSTSAVTIHGYNLSVIPLSVDKGPVLGVMQIKVPIPTGQDCDTQVVVQVGDAKSQPGVTIAMDICI